MLSHEPIEWPDEVEVLVDRQEAKSAFWKRWTTAGALMLIGGLSSCASTSPQPEIAAGQRRCVLYHPYYYNSDKLEGRESEIRNALTVQISGGEKYTLRPYRSLQVPIPRSGAVVEVMDDPLATFGATRKSESARIPAGGDTAYVRISRSQGIGGVTMTPTMGIPVAGPSYIADRAKLVSAEVAKKELAEFE